MKLLLIALLLCSSTVLAQAAKTPLGIKCEPRINDTVGTELCTALRDTVSVSPRYSEVDQNEHGFEVEVLTTTTQQNINTAASMVVSYDNLYLDHEIKVCGATAVRRCAEGFLATLDDDIRTFQKDYAATHHQPLR
jgi:hypothetical protein